MSRLGINGLGRIGQALIRALDGAAAHSLYDPLELVALYDLADLTSLPYHLNNDSRLRPYGDTFFNVRDEHDNAILHGQKINAKMPAINENSQAIWNTNEVDLVLDCSGAFNTRSDLKRQFFAELGAHKSTPNPRMVLLSNPGEIRDDSPEYPRLIIPGTTSFKSHLANSEETIYSSGSCTSCSLAPVIEALSNLGTIESVQSLTLHSPMNDQPLDDKLPSLTATKSHLGRAAGHAIPIETKLDLGLTRLYSLLKDKISSLSLRVGGLESCGIHTFITLQEQFLPDDIHHCFETAEAENPHIWRLIQNNAPFSSADVIGDSHSVVIDPKQMSVTTSNGRTHLSLTIWFDHEVSYAARMLEVALLITVGVD